MDLSEADTRAKLIDPALHRRGWTEDLNVFNAPCVVEAGGLEALKVLGDPKDIIIETKRRLFTA